MKKSEILDNLAQYHEDKGPSRKLFHRLFDIHRTEVACLIDFLAEEPINSMDNDDDIAFDTFLQYANEVGQARLFSGYKLLTNNSASMKNIFRTWWFSDAIQARFSSNVFFSTFEISADLNPFSAAMLMQQVELSASAARVGSLPAPAEPNPVLANSDIVRVLSSNMSNALQMTHIPETKFEAPQAAPLKLEPGIDVTRTDAAALSIKQ